MVGSFYGMPEFLTNLLTFMAKFALAGNCNVILSSFNFGNLPKELSVIYVANLIGSSLL